MAVGRYCQASGLSTAAVPARPAKAAGGNSPVAFAGQRRKRETRTASTQRRPHMRPFKVASKKIHFADQRGTLSPRTRAYALKRFPNPGRKGCPTADVIGATTLDFAFYIYIATIVGTRTAGE